MLKVCGQIGVIRSPFTEGLIIGPPADNEYAVEPVAVEDFEEGVADKTVSAPAADIDETNVLQKLAALPHKERVAFYTKHYDLITRASLIAAREHEQRLRNGEVI